MVKVEYAEVWGWKGAIRGMRDPMNSWGLSDSLYTQFREEEQKSLGEFYYEIFANGWIKVDKTGKIIEQNFSDTVGDLVGPNDMALMKKLIAGGPEHRKFLRMIHIQMDIIAPLYWWKEFDTYKVGTVANSCSTMHRIAEKEFVMDDFSHEHLVPGSIGILDLDIKRLNFCRDFYNSVKDKESWWQMIQLLPSSYNQRRTVDFNYETAMTIIKQRTGHKLDEWRMFCLTLMDLPYMEDFTDCLWGMGEET